MNIELTGWAKEALDEYCVVVKRLHDEEMMEHLGGIGALMRSGDRMDGAIGVQRHNELVDRLTQRRRAFYLRPALQLAEAWEDLWREREATTKSDGDAGRSERDKELARAHQVINRMQDMYLVPRAESAEFYELTRREYGDVFDNAEDEKRRPCSSE